MDDRRAHTLLADERQRLEALMAATGADASDNREAEDHPGDWGDGAQPLTAEGADDAVAASLQTRLEAVERADRAQTPYPT